MTRLSDALETALGRMIQEQELLIAEAKEQLFESNFVQCAERLQSMGSYKFTELEWQAFEEEGS